MNDIWAHWAEADDTFVIEGNTLQIRTFVDEDGECFTIASIFNPQSNISKAIFYHSWE